MQAFMLLLSLSFVDYSTALTPTRGGDSADLSANDSPTTGTDAPPNSVAAPVAPFSRDDGTVASPAIVERPSPGADIRTGQCQCQARGEGACYCLKTGNKCYCPTRGPSTWELTQAGAPVRKVQKSSPLTTPAPTVHRSSGSQPVGYVPELRDDGKYHWDDGKTTWWYSAKPTDGLTLNIDGTTWECVDGRMRLQGSVMAVQIAPKAASGHWEKRCFGSYCKMIWVPN